MRSYQAVKDYFSNPEDTVAQWNGDESSKALMDGELAAAEDAGLLGGELGNLLRARLDVRKIDIKSKIRRFIATNVSEERRENRRKLNRRYGMKYPGYSPKRQPKVLLCLDVSGSMYNALETCVTFLHAVSMGLKIDYCCWDTRCSLPEPALKRISEYNVTGGGGTDPNCVVEMYNENRLSYSVVILLTDCIFEWNVPPTIARKIMIIRTPTSGDWAHDFPEWCLAKVEFNELAEELAKEIK